MTLLVVKHAGLAQARDVIGQRRNLPVGKPHAITKTMPHAEKMLISEAASNGLSPNSA